MYYIYLFLLVAEQIMLVYFKKGLAEIGAIYYTCITNHCQLYIVFMTSIKTNHSFFVFECTQNNSKRANVIKMLRNKMRIVRG